MRMVNFSRQSAVAQTSGSSIMPRSLKRTSSAEHAAQRKQAILRRRCVSRQAGAQAVAAAALTHSPCGAPCTRTPRDMQRDAVFGVPRATLPARIPPAARGRGRRGAHCISGITLLQRVTMPLTETSWLMSSGIRSRITLVSRRLYGLVCAAGPAAPRAALTQRSPGAAAPSWPRAEQIVCACARRPRRRALWETKTRHQDGAP